MSPATAVEAVLFAALEKPATEWAAFLDSACAGDAGLRRQVEKLLKAHANVGDFLHKPAVELLASTPGAAPDPNLTTDHGAASSDESQLTGAQDSGLPVVPGYRVLGEIARGGMGRVLAAHDHSLGRDVALKVLLPGSNAERFVRESKITARLPHPGIPPVHALGTLADGSPFLAMKLIAGQTLAEQMKTADRPRLLQAFTQVCQAVGFAHSRGIVHRDLKPANVMVGAFGEVQVMDWGLAKDLASRDVPAEPDSLHVSAVPGDGADANQTADHRWPGESTDDQTRAGQVMGTPAYMAPEQARGEVADTRADVFALGGILCAILTGQAPYRGKSSLEVIQLARAADLDDAFARLDGCGADAELVALCRRCLSPSPADRPADGREVADGMTAYLDGVQERLQAAVRERAVALAREAEQRKQRWTVQVAGGLIALVLLAGLSASLWQMFRANENARQAEEERDAKGRAEADATANAKQAWDEANAKAVALKAEQQARKGETKALIAEQQARKQAFAALRSVTEKVVEKKFTQRAALTEDDRAFLRGVIGQFDAFAAIRGEDADSRAVRAEGRFRVGNIRSTLGEYKEAEKDYDQALGIQKQLVADFPARPEFRFELAMSHNNRGELLSETGRFKEAEKEYDKALGLYKQLADDFPSRPKYHQNLASSLKLRGSLLRDTGRLGEAEKDFDQAIGIQKQLVTDSPTQPEFRVDLALSYHGRGDLLRATGRPGEAEQDLRRALSIQKQLADEFPSRPEYLLGLASGHGNLGVLLSDTGRPGEAEKAHDKALGIVRQLAADFPSRPEFRQFLATSLNNRGHLLSGTGRPKEAEKDYEQALSIQKQLAKDFPTRPEFRLELARSQTNRANLLYATSRLKEAEKDYDQAIGIQKQLVATFPSRPDFREELAMGHGNRGNLLRITGRPKEAEKDFDEALGRYKQLVADFPSRSDFRLKLGNSHNNRGILLFFTGRPKEAVKDYDQAVSIYKELIARAPNQPVLRNQLAGTCVNLAMAHLRQRDRAGAKRLLLEGRPHHLAALKANPRHPEYRQFYRNHLALLAQAHAGLSEKDNVVRTAEARRDVGWDAPEDAYDAASFLSMCIRIVVFHDTMNISQRKEAAQVYGDAAMRLLREAVSKGYKDVTRLKKDSDFVPLRGRKDFQKLVAELEGEGK
jgi:tetratricopeptide (TPR) repeat protein